MLQRRKYTSLILFLILACIAIMLSIPGKLFNDPSSTVITSIDDELLGAKIASDGQWRFPEIDSIPPKFAASILTYEDRFFYKHPGFNPVSMMRAAITNLKAGKIISGGSTITMQTMRLSRKNKPRSFKEKIIEIWLATGLEIKYSKDEILKLYISHAPFGGNVVGLEAASWRYYHRNPWELSWAESATLAVLPNSPALVHPGRNRDRLAEKRNLLLKKLLRKNIIDSLTYELSLLEPVPEKPVNLPGYSAHLLERIHYQAPGVKTKTSINAAYQERLYQIINNQKDRLYSNHINNMACIILENRTGRVSGYFGNIQNSMHPEFGGDNDMVIAPRSTGSIMKPVLFGFMLDRGDILPETLVPDIPTRYRNFNPKNFNRGYDGVVPAKRALERSLNIPAVRMLKKYGVNRFYNDLKQIGITTLVNDSDHYGLSLILGGAEATLWEIGSIYSSWARVLNNYNHSDGKYFRQDYKKPVYSFDKIENSSFPEEHGIIGAGAIYLTFTSLLEVNRPETETGWESFSSSRLIAWKTGTSFGFRDAWAVGITPDYVVAVWAGNAGGEGRAGLTGVAVAAPVMFEVFNFLPPGSWFEIPYDDLVKAEICALSGHRAGIYCPSKDSVFLPIAGLNSPPCPYHKLIHLSEDKQFRVNASCYEPTRIIQMPWFILPPVQEFYYRSRTPSYLPLPPLMSSCHEDENPDYMDLIYPENGSVVYIPLEMGGNRGRMICEAAHRYNRKTIFWHLDDEYIGKTENIHQMAILANKGKHLLTLVDQDGNKLSTSFDIVDK